MLRSRHRPLRGPAPRAARKLPAPALLRHRHLVHYRSSHAPRDAHTAGAASCRPSAPARQGRPPLARSASNRLVPLRGGRRRERPNVLMAREATVFGHRKIRRRTRATATSPAPPSMPRKRRDLYRAMCRTSPSTSDSRHTGCRRPEQFAREHGRNTRLNCSGPTADRSLYGTIDHCKCSATILPKWAAGPSTAATRRACSRKTLHRHRRTICYCPVQPRSPVQPHCSTMQVHLWFRP